MDPIAILKDFGFPIALCGVLLLALRHMFTVYDKAQKSRIGAIEAALSDSQEQVKTANAEAARKSAETAAVLHALLARHEANLTTHNTLMRQTLEVLRRLVESMGARRCMVDEYHPQTPRPQPPTPADLPRDPVTERTTGRA